MTVQEFIKALNSYEGDNIWQDLIYSAELDSDEVDIDRCTNPVDSSPDVIYLKSGRNIIYYKGAKLWK